MLTLSRWYVDYLQYLRTHISFIELIALLFGKLSMSLTSLFHVYSSSTVPAVLFDNCCTCSVLEKKKHSSHKLIFRCESVSLQVHESTNVSSAYLAWAVFCTYAGDIYRVHVTLTASISCMLILKQHLCIAAMATSYFIIGYILAIIRKFCADLSLPPLEY